MGVEADIKKTEYMFISYHQISAQIHRETANEFQNAAMFKHLGTSVTNKN
jgi:hypothetical protein